MVDLAFAKSHWRSTPARRHDDKTLNYSTVAATALGFAHRGLRGKHTGVFGGARNRQAVLRRVTQPQTGSLLI